MYTRNHSHFLRLLPFVLPFLLLLGLFSFTAKAEGDSTEIKIDPVSPDGNGPLTVSLAVENQLIVLGSKTTLVQIQNEFSGTIALVRPIYSDTHLSQASLALFEVIDGSSPQEVISNTQGFYPEISISLNYVMVGLQWIVGGSPTSSGWPVTTTLVPLPQQPSLGQIGDLPTGWPNGQNVDVYVFDAFCGEHFIEPTLQISTTEITSPPKNFCGHGDAAIDLISYIAPKATLHPRAVLNKHVLGDTMILLKSIIDAGEQHLEQHGTLENTVWNFSLRILAEPEEKVEPLKDILQNIYNQGGVIVASAGNEANDYSNIPARYPFVVNVGAVDEDGNPTSYTNRAIVYAPGGKGDCDINPLDCLILRDPGSSTGYSAVAGTSFAAPLVSGLAALLLEDKRMTSPQEVANCIYAGSRPQGPSLGAGIIHVPDTLALTSCEPTTETVVLSLEPSTLTTGVDETFELPIVVHAGTQEVDGAAAHLNFDPAHLEVVTITQGSDFSSVILNQFDNASGQLDFAAGNLSTPFPSGTFTLATVTFSTTAPTAQNGTVVEFNSTLPRSSDVTFDGTSVLDHTEESTIFIQNATLTGTVTLQGRPAPPHPRWSVPLRVSFTIPGESTPAYTFEPTTDENGHFPLSGIAPGTYEVRVKNSHTLQNKQTVTVVGGDNGLIDFGTLREGDANDDNYVTLLDFSILVSTFAKCEGTTGYDARADFNGDGCVTILDFSLLASNFAQAGDHRPEGRAAEADAPTGNASLIIDQPIIQARAGDTYLVTVRLEADSPVDGAAAYIDFDQSLLKVNSLRSGEAFDLELQQQFDNQTGSINFAAGTLTSPPLLGGEGLGVRGDFLVIELEAIGDGESPLTFQFDAPRSTEVTAGGVSVLNDVSDGSNSTTTAVEVTHLATNGTAPLAWLALVLISLLVMGVGTVRWLVGLRIAIK